MLNQTQTVTVIRRACTLVSVVAVLYLMDMELNQQVVVEKAKDLKLPKVTTSSCPHDDRPRKTYADFVSIAKVDHKKIIGIPWVRLPDLEDYLPSYLKYKEKLLTPVMDQGVCASCWSISVVQMIADRISVYTGG